MALAPNFTSSAFPISQLLHFKQFLLEVVAIGRKNAGKDPDNLSPLILDQKQIFFEILVLYPR